MSDRSGSQSDPDNFWSLLESEFNANPFFDPSDYGLDSEDMRTHFDTDPHTGGHFLRASGSPSKPTWDAATQTRDMPEQSTSSQSLQSLEARVRAAEKKLIEMETKIEQKCNTRSTVVGAVRQIGRDIMNLDKQSRDIDRVYAKMEDHVDIFKDEDLPSRVKSLEGKVDQLTSHFDIKGKAPYKPHRESDDRDSYSISTSDLSDDDHMLHQAHKKALQQAPAGLDETRKDIHSLATYLEDQFDDVKEELSILQSKVESHDALEDRMEELQDSVDRLTKLVQSWDEYSDSEDSDSDGSNSDGSGSDGSDEDDEDVEDMIEALQEMLEEQNRETNKQLLEMQRKVDELMKDRAEDRILMYIITAVFVVVLFAIRNERFWVTSSH